MPVFSLEDFHSQICKIGVPVYAGLELMRIKLAFVDESRAK